MTFASACQKSADFRLVHLTAPFFLNSSGMTCDMSDWPLKGSTTTGSPTNHIFDVIRYEGVLADLQELFPKFETDDYESFPFPFSPARPTGGSISMDVFVIPEQMPNVFKIVKHFRSLGQRMPRAVAVALCRGQAYVLDTRGANAKAILKALEMLLENYSGQQVRYSKLVLSHLPRTQIEPNAIDAGYDYIMRESPVTSEGLARLRWIAKEVSDEGSPIYGWKKADVKEAIDTLHREGSLAKTQSYIPITIQDLAPHIKRILKDVIPTLKTQSLVFVGRPGWGKTPLMQVLAMAMSKYWIDEGREQTRLNSPCFRVAESLDFFRGEPGLLERPDIFDDGDMNLQPITSLKAFLDQSRVEAMIWARWGASKFQKHQLRAIADNKLASDAEPQIFERIKDGKEIRHEHFLDIVTLCCQIK